MKEGDRVAIWGAGPIGLFAAKWSLDIFKASQVVIIDDVPERLIFAENKINQDPEKLQTVNFGQRDVLKELKRMMPGGPDVVIDAAGFRYAKTMFQKIERALYLSTDQCDVLTEAITAVRKVGFSPKSIRFIL